MGVSQQRFGLITNQGRAQINKIERYSYSEFLDVISYLKSLYEDRAFSIEEVENKSDSNFECGAGYRTIKITPEFLVTPRALMSFNIGNLTIESLETVFKRSTKVFMKIQSPNTSICKDCYHKEYCKGCISESIIRKNDVNSCAWYNQESHLLSMCMG